MRTAQQDTIQRVVMMERQYALMIVLIGPRLTTLIYWDALVSVTPHKLSKYLTSHQSYDIIRIIKEGDIK